MKNPSTYYAVIFTNQRTESDSGYNEMAQKMEDLAALQPGFLGYETARSDIGISISYWESLEAITRWKNHADHLEAQKLGRAKWYQWYKLRICKVEREYDFQRQD